MAGVEDKKRVVALCKSCESVYTARVLNDGSLVPIGTDACRCGCEEFRELER